MFSGNSSLIIFEALWNSLLIFMLNRSKVVHWNLLIVLLLYLIFVFFFLIHYFLFNCHDVRTIYNYWQNSHNDLKQQQLINSVRFNDV